MAKAVACRTVASDVVPDGHDRPPGRHLRPVVELPLTDLAVSGIVLDRIRGAGLVRPEVDVLVGAVRPEPQTEPDEGPHREHPHLELDGSVGELEPFAIGDAHAEVEHGSTVDDAGLGVTS